MRGSYRAMCRRAAADLHDRETDDFKRKVGLDRPERMCVCGHEFQDHCFGGPCDPGYDPKTRSYPECKCVAFMGVRTEAAV